MTRYNNPPKFKPLPAEHLPARTILNSASRVSARVIESLHVKRAQGLTQIKLALRL